MQSASTQTVDPIRDLIGRGREMAMTALGGLPTLQRQAIEALDAVAACRELEDRTAAAVGQRLAESAEQLEAIGEAAGRRINGGAREVRDAEDAAKRDAGSAVATKCLASYKASATKAGETAYLACTVFENGIVRGELDWSNAAADLPSDLASILKRDAESEAIRSRGVEAFHARYLALSGLGDVAECARLAGLTESWLTQVCQTPKTMLLKSNALMTVDRVTTTQDLAMKLVAMFAEARARARPAALDAAKLLLRNYLYPAFQEVIGAARGLDGAAFQAILRGTRPVPQPWELDRDWLQRRVMAAPTWPTAQSTIGNRMPARFAGTK